MSVLEPLPKQLAKQLKKEVENFFYHAVDLYLDELLQKSLKSKNDLKFKGELFSIQRFIENVKAQDFSGSLQFPLEMINKWKQEFTKKVLIPKYLLQHYQISLAQLTDVIKKAILDAALRKKLSFYINICQTGLMRSLGSLPPSRRYFAAKHFVHTACLQFQKEDTSFPKEPFLKAFDALHLKQLLEHIPLKIRSRANPNQEKLYQEVSDSVLKQIRSKLDQEKHFLLTKQLHIINQYLVQLKKNPEVLHEWGFKKMALTDELKKHLSEVLLKEKAEIFFKFYLREVQSIKKTCSFESFAKLRQAILNKYLESYIQEEDFQAKPVREYFLDCLKKERHQFF